MNRIIFQDPLTTDNGGWTIPDPVREASTYTNAGWWISSTNGYQRVKCNTVIGSENFTIEFTYLTSGASSDVVNLLLLFYNNETNLNMGLLYSTNNSSIEFYQSNSTLTNHTLVSGDRVVFKYEYGQATITVNGETVLEHEYTGKTLTGSHPEIHTSHDRYVQISDFKITQGE